MTPMKTFGLVALAAVMVLAFAGASAARAESTALCTIDPSETNECPKGWTVSHLHATTLSGQKVKISTSLVSVECDTLFLGDAAAELATPLVISGTFTYSNCTNSCTITEENGPASLTFLKLGHETADLTLGFLIHLTCSGIACYYKGSEVKGTAKGPLLSSESDGEGSFVAQTLSKEKGVFCPNEAKLEAIGTPLDARYITS